MTHPTWQLDLTDGALILTPCPGTKGVELLASLEQLKAQGVEAIVTALDDHELAEHQVAELGSLTEQLGMQWFQLPIEDDCAPGETFAEQWRNASPELHAVLARNGKVALHCLGGSGRTGLFAAHILLEQQWPLAKIIHEVQALRPGAFTKPPQKAYVEALAGN